VTSADLARSYLAKARIRLQALAVLRDGGGRSDVVREAQELVELALKGMLRAVGVEPPKIHDVGRLLLEHAAPLPSRDPRRVAPCRRDLRALAARAGAGLLR